MLRTQNLCPGSRNVFDLRQKHFCFRAAKFVSATYVSLAAILQNICLRDNVSATMFPSLARPLEQLTCDLKMTTKQFSYGKLKNDLQKPPQSNANRLL